MGNCAAPVPWGGLASASHPVFSGEIDPDETHLAKGMKIRILASEFKSCLHGNPPTVWKKKQKDLEVYSLNQMRRWLCEINRMLKNKIEMGEKLPQKYSQRFIN